MDDTTLSNLLYRLIDNWENEVVEFKRGGEGSSSAELGKYVSAMANEANLREQPRAWLVFGVDDKSRSVVGTGYKKNIEHLQADKIQVRDGTGSVTFREIHVLAHPDGRVLLFEIPAAPRGMPVAWNGHYYGRAGESLIALDPDKLDEIRSQTLTFDWTAQIVPDATIADLDELALKMMRTRFAAKHRNISPKELDAWDDTFLLDRARITRNGKVTRAALLLLGKRETTWYLNPHLAEITWKLEGEQQAYEHFSPPFLVTTSQVYDRIRNVQLRLLPPDGLIAYQVEKYDRNVILEALHNCIAHQDYTRLARIIVVEHPDRLVFESMGSFFEEQPEDYVLHAHMPRHYRNPFLVQAMAELNMIDRMGYGILGIYRRQRERFFPLPDYDLDKPDCVRLTIHGRVVDLAYSHLLMQKTGLPLADVLALDRVQKKFPIPDDVARRLRRKRFIEGRKPNIHVSAKIAAATATKADYIRTRAQDDEHYAKLIIDYLTTFERADRAELDRLLTDKLSDSISAAQKQKKISNLLTKMKRCRLIYNTGSRKYPVWRILE
ncbi:MAG: putative DNA binding domain-containing protein [Gammaproteobacteria bacterium]|nr:putative DNA binding domain-containing protein [Gammaproteobacteria bacterium]